MASFDSVNYAVRPNKAVERKLVFSALLRLSRVLDLSSFRYIGLGSIWFVDFVMAHKLLGIAEMVSIEQNEMGYRRAKYNKPLGCIEIIHGETSLVIPDLALEEKPSIVWFDYDSSIGGPALSDIQSIISKCAPNSIILVTLSAKIDDLQDKDENGKSIDREISLRKIAGDLVPTPLSLKRLQRKNYPRLISEILSNQFSSTSANSGRKEQFIKLFDIIYTDGTPMVTMGGIMADPESSPKINEIVESDNWEGIVAELINIPPLTLKEKVALDQMLPSEKVLSPADIDKIGFALKVEQIENYQRYYIHYPTFGEFQF